MCLSNNDITTHNKISSLHIKFITKTPINIDCKKHSHTFTTNINKPQPVRLVNSMHEQTTHLNLIVHLEPSQERLLATFVICVTHFCKQFDIRMTFVCVCLFLTLHYTKLSKACEVQRSSGLVDKLDPSSNGRVTAWRDCRINPINQCYPINSMWTKQQPPQLKPVAQDAIPLVATRCVLYWNDWENLKLLRNKI